MTAATITFPARIAAARHTLTAARAERDKVLAQVKPLSPEMHAVFVTKPEDYAKCLRRQADLMDTLPALHAAVTTAEQALSPLEKRACWKCRGTGTYTAPTSAYRRGVPYCFDCNGAGHTR